MNRKNIKIKEEYTLKQYKSCKYSFVTGNYDREISEKLIVGDDKYYPDHVMVFDSGKISKAYNDALLLNTTSDNNILEYINKYGLPVSDGDYNLLQENTNHLKDYIINSKINVFYAPEDFNDINSLYYTQKAISLFQATVKLQKSLNDYTFYNKDSSDLNIYEITCNIFQSLIRVMMLLDRNCLVPSVMRHHNSNYCICTSPSKTTVEFKGTNELTNEIFNYLNAQTQFTNSSLFTYNSFQNLDFNSADLTIEPLLKSLLSSGKGYTFSHGKIQVSSIIDVSAEVNPSINTKHTLLLVKISEAAIEICRSEKKSLNEIFLSNDFNINFYKISEKYTLLGYGKDYADKICEEIHKAAELFYFEIFTDLLIDCPPTIRLENDTVVYSRQLPNLIQALFNKLYKEAFIKYKICLGCGKAFPANSRRSDAKYCSFSCGRRTRKKKSRAKNET